MGTYAIFRQLQHHWLSKSHPIYRLDLDRLAPGWLKRDGMYPTGKERSIIDAFGPLVLIAVLLLIVVNRSFMLESAIGAGVLLFIGTWIGTMQVTMASSRLIAQEKELHTWDTVLTLPCGWDDLVLIKLAVALRTFSLKFLLWLQGFFVAVLYGSAIAQILSSARSLPQGAARQYFEVYLVLAVVALIGFTVGRIQDFVLLSLIGIAISVLASSRQIAVAAGAIAGAAYLLFWTIVALLVIPLTGPISPFEPISIGGAAAIVGPSGSVTLGLPLPAAIVSIIGLIIYREVLIQAIFGWLSHHLSEA